MTTRGIVITGCAGIVLLDAVFALAADAFDFDYGVLAPASLAIYALIGFAAARSARSVSLGVVGGGAVALTDATLGWALSWAIGPGAPDPEDRGAEVVVITVLFVAALGVALGFLAGLVRRRVGPG